MKIIHLKLHTIITGLILFAVSISHADEVLNLFRQAAKATQETPFHGTMEYKRQVFDQTWITEFTIEHLPDVATKLVFISPEVVKGNIVIRTNEGLWVTPLTDDNRDQIMKEMEPFPWHRLLDSDKELFFQASFDLDHDDLLLKNYKLQTDFHSNQKAVFHVLIEPDNKYRPSMKCKFDRDKLVQRSCKHYNHEKKLDESFSFIDLTVNPGFDNQTFSLDTLKKIHSFEPKNDSSPPKLQPDFITMALQWLPKGFELVHADVWDGKRGMTHHSVYSDGFARLSVYQRKLSEKEIDKLKNKSQENDDTCVVNRIKQRSEWVYFRDMNALRISAVGDISPKSIGKTLSKIDVE